MKIKINHTLKDPDGKPLLETIEFPDKKGNMKKKTFEVTFKYVCVNALLNLAHGEGQPSADERVTRGQLADKINKAQEEVHLTSSQITLILSRIEKFASTWAYYQCHKILEG